MFESAVITLVDGIVCFVSDALFADMAGLAEDSLIEKMKFLGYAPLLRIYSENVDSATPVILTFTKRKIYQNELPAQIEGM